LENGAKKTMSITIKGITWSGLYLVGKSSTIHSPKYYIIVDSEGDVVAVDASAQDIPGKDLFLKHHLNTKRKYRIGYKDLNECSESDVDEILDYFRELYGMG
jgi:hypothetical protein